MAAIFDLAPATRDTSMEGGFTTSLAGPGVTKAEVSYLDFTVDGELILPRLNRVADGNLDVVSVVQDAWPVEAVAGIARLLGEEPGDLPDGRVSLYVCPECGDLGCGSVSARIVFAPDTVTWREIGWQTDYDPEVAPLGPDGERPAITVDRLSYEAALRSVRERLRPLASDFEYPHQRARRLRRKRRQQIWVRLLRRW